MEKSARQFVFEGMELIPNALADWVEKRATDKMMRDWNARRPAHHRPRRARANKVSRDLSELLNFTNAFWLEMSAQSRDRTLRAHVNELLGIRNRLAHNERFTYDDVERALDTMRRLMAGIGAQAEAEKLTQLREMVLRRKFAAPPAAQSASPPPPPPPPPPPAAQSASPSPSPRKKITPEMVMKACELASNVHKQRLPREAAKAELVKLGMNPASAATYIQIYLTMLEGKVLKRAVKIGDFRLLMEHILQTHGRGAFAKAVAAFALHVEYKAGLGIASPGLYTLLKEMKKRLGD